MPCLKKWQEELLRDDLFLIVVVGEFNSGKSAVINALLGYRLLEEGVTKSQSQL